MEPLTSLFEPGGLLHSPIPMHLRIADCVTAFVLAYAGVSGLLAYRVHRGAPDIRYWLLAGAGMLYLAVDELQSVHERFGKWLWAHGWQAPAPFTHNDDALLFMLALCGLGVTAVHFRALLAHRRAARLLLAGLGLTGLVLVLDALALHLILEEAVELTAALVLAAAFATRLHRGAPAFEVEPPLAAVELTPPR